MIEAAIHHTFTIERTYPTKAAQVFRAHAEAERKRRWFAEGEGFVVASYSLDFRVGGFERCRFSYGDGPAMTYDATYLDIVPDERIIFAYGLMAGGEPVSSSLCTVELLPRAPGTLLRYTEQTAFLDGNDGSAARREGSVDLLETLARELAAND